MTLDRAEEVALRDRARRVQALYINLLFCRHTREAWLSSPGSVLDRFELVSDVEPLIVDVASDQFKAEAHGRCVVVERSIGNIFVETNKRLAQRATQSGFSNNDPTFDDFLCSEYFLDPHQGLPHASGIGPGYENFSKYFFWLRSAFHLENPESDLTMRNHAYSEFGAYLIGQFKRPHEPYYDQFEGGVYWSRVPGDAMPVMLLSDKYVLFTIGNAETARQIRASGMVNLDNFSRPEWEDEATLV